MNKAKSRRTFIGNLAVLTAGATLAPVTRLFAGGANAVDLRELWKTFCRKHGCRPAGEMTLQDPLLLPCAGHRHHAGEAVWLPKEGLYLLPTWIYWKEDMQKPDDLVVSFFAGDQTRLFAANRYELEAVCRMEPHPEGRGWLEDFKKARTSRAPAGQRRTGLQTRTVISGRRARSVVTVTDEQYNTNKHTIYHS